MSAPLRLEVHAGCVPFHHLPARLQAELDYRTLGAFADYLRKVDAGEAMNTEPAVDLMAEALSATLGRDFYVYRGGHHVAVHFETGLPDKGPALATVAFIGGTHPGGGR